MLNRQRTSLRSGTRNGVTKSSTTQPVKREREGERESEREVQACSRAAGSVGAVHLLDSTEDGGLDARPAPPSAPQIRTVCSHFPTWTLRLALFSVRRPLRPGAECAGDYHGECQALSIIARQRDAAYLIALAIACAKDPSLLCLALRGP